MRLKVRLERLFLGASVSGAFGTIQAGCSSYGTRLFEYCPRDVARISKTAEESRKMRKMVPSSALNANVSEKMQIYARSWSVEIFRENGNLRETTVGGDLNNREGSVRVVHVHQCAHTTSNKQHLISHPPADLDLSHFRKIYLRNTIANIKNLVRRRTRTRNPNLRSFSSEDHYTYRHCSLFTPEMLRLSRLLLLVSLFETSLALSCPSGTTSTACLGEDDLPESSDEGASASFYVEDSRQAPVDIHEEYFYTPPDSWEQAAEEEAPTSPTGPKTLKLMTYNTCYECSTTGTGGERWEGIFRFARFLQEGPADKAKGARAAYKEAKGKEHPARQVRGRRFGGEARSASTSSRCCSCTYTLRF